MNAMLMNPPSPVLAPPERREGVAIGPLLAAALDELDYGLALADAGARVLHLNHRAQRCLGEGALLMLRDDRIAARDAHDAGALGAALRDAAERGLRRLLHLGRGDAGCSAAVVPVQPGVAALMLGRSHLCEDLSLRGFARAHALSDAEARVLLALGRGQAPAEIAREHGVAMSTVRTQIGAIRGKTGAASIRDLLRMVAALPPIVGALRH
jgi:DNA-binding CsgD family transcriptional regulator